MVVASAVGLVSTPPVHAAVTGFITHPVDICVDVSGGNSANGTPVQLWGCNGTEAQQWTTQSDGTIHALGKCLDVSGGNTAIGTRVQLWDCNGTGAQMWARSNLGLINPQSGRCLDATAGNTAPGTPLQIWDCNGTAAQQWNLPAGSDVLLYDASTGTVTFTLHALDQGLPAIICHITASTPAVRSLGGGLYVTSIGSTVCSSPVVEIDMTHTLFINGISVAQDVQNRIGGNNVATEPDIVCIAGLWSTFADATIVLPEGYDIVPTRHVIFTTNDTRPYISPGECLGNVIGMSDGAARTYIQQQLHLTIGTVRTQASDAPVGNVISQSLEANGTVVDLVESAGNAIVPSLIGYSQDTAERKIAEAGLTLRTVSTTRVAEQFDAGKVWIQTPSAGSPTNVGAPVDIYVGIFDDTGGGHR
jgi:hypothetical protein